MQTTTAAAHPALPASLHTNYHCCCTICCRFLLTLRTQSSLDSRPKQSSGKASFSSIARCTLFILICCSLPFARALSLSLSLSLSLLHTYARVCTRRRRYDDKFIYVGAEISEPEVWANITHTCTKEPAPLLHATLHTCPRTHTHTCTHPPTPASTPAHPTCSNVVINIAMQSYHQPLQAYRPIPHVLM